jgi:hypothetical protein
LKKKHILWYHELGGIPMPGEIENAARSMMSSPQGMKVIKVLDQFNAAMNTENGRQLIQMLASDGGDALKAAAKSAISARRDPGRALLHSLLNTQEGASLAAKIIEVMGL